MKSTHQSSSSSIRGLMFLISFIPLVTSQLLVADFPPITLDRLPHKFDHLSKRSEESQRSADVHFLNLLLQLKPQIKQVQKNVKGLESKETVITTTTTPVTRSTTTTSSSGLFAQQMPIPAPVPQQEQLEQQVVQMMQQRATQKQLRLQQLQQLAKQLVRQQRESAFKRQQRFSLSSLPREKQIEDNRVVFSHGGEGVLKQGEGWGVMDGGRDEQGAESRDGNIENVIEEQAQEFPALAPEARPIPLEDEAELDTEAEMTPGLSPLPQGAQAQPLASEPLSFEEQRLKRFKLSFYDCISLYCAGMKGGDRNGCILKFCNRL